MTKFTSTEVLKISERLRRARDRSHAAHFLIGAGCSISAGIPSAAELIKKIHTDYAAQCADLIGDDLHSYGACMALLSINERRDLIRPYLEKAKINWGTIALAQLIVENFIGRVLTVNFDLVLENACGLLGLQPAVYDFGVAPANDPAMIVSPSIVHLHGQSYGLVLLNTDEETRKHREKLRPILTDSLRNAPLVVIGYSGSADGIFQTLLEEFEGREPLYWAGHDKEPANHIHPFLEKDHFQFIGGADFDRFMIELAQSLGCWPPHLFSDPLGHLLRELSPVVSYPVVNSDSAIDLLGDLRRKLESWQRTLNEQERRTNSLQEPYMKGDFERAATLFLSRGDPAAASSEDKEIAYWSFVAWGNLLFEQAKPAGGEEAARLFAAAREKYQAALAIRSDKHEVLNNLGNLLSEQAKRASGDEAARLFLAAAEKYQAALAIKPDSHGVLDNWGTLLLERARRASGDEAARLFVAAGEKYQAALAIKPDSHETSYNCGNLLYEQAKQASGDEAARLFAAAGEKYQAALAIKRDGHETLNNWGSLLSEQAKRASGDDAARLFVAAGEKYQAALAIKPDKHETLNNWGSLLSKQAKQASGDEAARLFLAAGEKYQAALAIKRDGHETLNNWGSLLSEQAKQASGDEAARLFLAAGEKYQAALAIKPDKHEALNNWGSSLSEQAKRASGDGAARLFVAAAEKYQAALAIKPDSHEALDNWGNLLLEQAKRASGDDAARLFASADEKLMAAAKIDPAKTYNLACLAALLGDESRCRHHLENSETHATLPGIEHLMADRDFDSVRDKPWFQEFLERQKTQRRG